MQVIIIVNHQCKLRIKPFLLAWVLAAWKNEDMLANQCRLALNKRQAKVETVPLIPLKHVCFVWWALAIYSSIYNIIF